MKKSLSIILTFALLLMACSCFVVSAADATPADTKVVSVDGTEMTLSEFAADAATNDYAGKTLTLLCDVVLSGEWGSIPSFKGTLNGNGKSITGLTAPLFTSLDGATVKNLTLNGTMTVSNSAVQYGIFAATSSEKVIFENCVNNVDLTYTITASSGDTKIAAFIGQATGSVTMKDCVNNGDLTYISKVGDNGVGCYMGGMIGQSTAATMEYTFTGCVNTGDIIATVLNAAGTASKTTLVGGFVGDIQAATTFVKCLNTGVVRIGADVTVGNAGHKVGGFAGAIEKVLVTVDSCVNYGDVYGYRYAGGLIGQAQPKMSMTNSYNYGNVTSGSDTKIDTQSYAGGLVAYLNASDGATVVGCTNYGTITAGANKKADIAAGGLIGAVVNPASLNSCSNYGAVTSAQLAGGLIGVINKADKNFPITNCFVSGTVQNTETTQTGAAVGGLIGQIKAGLVTAASSKYVKTVAEKAFTGTAEDASDTVYTVDDVAAWKALEEISFEGIQYTAAADGKFNVRFVSSLSSIAYLNAGYEIVRVYNNEVGAIDYEINTVYKSLTGYDASGDKTEYLATELGAEYLAALSVKDVPASGEVTFIVRPYLVNSDGTAVIRGDAYTVKFVDGALVK